MRRGLRLLLILSFILLPFKVLAVGDVTVSTTSLTIEKGKTASFTINVSNALGRVDITSNNTGIATISNSSVYLNSDEATSKSITVNAIAVGSTTITVNKTDIASFDNEQKTGTYIITVNVVEPSDTSTNTSTTSNTTSNTTVKGNTTTKNNTNTTTKSNTNKNTTNTNSTTNNTTDNTNNTTDNSISSAVQAVEKAEKSLSQNDYNTALALVNKLPEGAEKTALLKRLSTVASKIDVQSALSETCEECQECNSKLWTMISIILLIILIMENIYLAVKSVMKRKSNQYQK